MTSDPQQHVSLQPYNTLAIDAYAERFVQVADEADLAAALSLARRHNWPVWILGGGSNIVLQDNLPGLVIRIANKGVQLLHEDNDQVEVSVAAGENWDDWVGQSLARGYYGLENLALIPGTVGAAPIQNIGAYGIEVGEYIVSVRTMDKLSGAVEFFSRDDCQFAYRDSIFKHAAGHHKIVTAVTFRLFKNPRCRTDYPALRDELIARQQLSQATPAAVSDAVRFLRKSRLPDPVDIPNAGSFFKNPIVSASHARQLGEQFVDMPRYPVAPDQVKLSAAWLIDRAGWKGRAEGKVAVHQKQALVLTNPGKGSGRDVLQLAHNIAADIERLYAIKLEMEAVILPPTR